jgi:hypothetical protein
MSRLINEPFWNELYESEFYNIYKDDHFQTDELLTLMISNIRFKSQEPIDSAFQLKNVNLALIKYNLIYGYINYDITVPSSYKENKSFSQNTVPSDEAYDLVKEFLDKLNREEYNIHRLWTIEMNLRRRKQEVNQSLDEFKTFLNNLLTLKMKTTLY